MVVDILEILTNTLWIIAGIELFVFLFKSYKEDKNNGRKNRH